MQQTILQLLASKKINDQLPKIININRVLGVWMLIVREKLLTRTDDIPVIRFGKATMEQWLKSYLPVLK